jgi:Zn-dependent protease
LLSLQYLLLAAPPILFALTVHEFSHAYLAYRFGDSTGKDMGRMTLNPLPHLDPIGTLLLFVAFIGWAKPVPVNPNNLKNPRRDLLWIALAGPTSNFVLALFFGSVFRVLDHGGVFSGAGTVAVSLRMFVGYCVSINLVLAFFNLIPVYPLDGSKVLAGILPEGAAELFRRAAVYGPFVLIGLIALGRIGNVSILWSLIGPPVRYFSQLFAGQTML